MILDEIVSEGAYGLNTFPADAPLLDDSLVAQRQKVTRWKVHLFDSCRLVIFEVFGTFLSGFHHDLRNLGRLSGFTSSCHHTLHL